MKVKKTKPIRFDILTIFPKIFDSYFGESLFKRAVIAGLVQIVFHDLRQFSLNRHKKVDDTPFGGGPGMVMQVEPIYGALEEIKKKNSKKKKRIILFSTRGKKLNASIAKRLAGYDQLVLICGRYEGVDERVAENLADEEISIGDYVLSGGELPAMVLVEAVSRFVPGFLGKYESLEEVKGSYAVYTKPEVFKPTKGKGWKVPKVLLSGNHKKIAEWRKDNSSST
ncbi:MAG: tRNA (guanosine(37)-N1)-methyltransferase TrmD [Patescibacteria group bacterium]